MHETRIEVRGPSVTELPPALCERLSARKGTIEQYTGDGFTVVVVEQYFLRNNSNQQATVVLERVDENVLEVAILAGGGGAGLSQLNLGSEFKQAEQIVSAIEDICESRELRVERD